MNMKCMSIDEDNIYYYYYYNSGDLNQYQYPGMIWIAVNDSILQVTISSSFILQVTSYI